MWYFYSPLSQLLLHSTVLVWGMLQFSSQFPWTGESKAEVDCNMLTNQGLVWRIGPCLTQVSHKWGKASAIAHETVGDHRSTDAWDRGMHGDTHRPSKAPRRCLCKTARKIKTFKRSYVYGWTEKATCRYRLDTCSENTWGELKLLGSENAHLINEWLPWHRASQQRLEEVAVFPIFNKRSKAYKETKIWTTRKNKRDR